MIHAKLVKKNESASFTNYHTQQLFGMKRRTEIDLSAM